MGFGPQQRQDFGAGVQGADHRGFDTGTFGEAEHFGMEVWCEAVGDLQRAIACTLHVKFATRQAIEDSLIGGDVGADVGGMGAAKFESAGMRVSNSRAEKTGHRAILEQVDVFANG